MSRFNDHGRRKFPAGLMPPRNQREYDEYSIHYTDVPPVPTQPAQRKTISDVDLRKQRTDEHAELMRRKPEEPCRLRYVPASVARPARIVPVRAEQPAPHPVRAIETPKSVWEPDATALHEAAHHIVAEKLGCKIERTTIEPRRRDDDGGLIYGSCRYAPPQEHPLVHAIAIYSAGGVAELMEFGRYIGGPDTASVEQMLDEAGIADKSEREKLVAEAHFLARALLVPEKTKVREMAKHLRSVKTIKPEPGLKVRTASVPMMIRSGTVNAASNDVVDVVWTTGAAVRRVGIDGESFDEVLLTGEKNVRLGRLNAGAPLLNSHDSSDLSRILGSVVKNSARMVNGQGVARVKLSSRAEVAGLVQDILDGVIVNVSVGYRYHKVERDTGGAVQVWRVTDWEPMELSAVAIPADAGASFRGEERYPCEVRG